MNWLQRNEKANNSIDMATVKEAIEKSVQRQKTKQTEDKEEQIKTEKGEWLRKLLPVEKNDGAWECGFIMVQSSTMQWGSRFPHITMVDIKLNPIFCPTILPILHIFFQFKCHTKINHIKTIEKSAEITPYKFEKKF